MARYVEKLIAKCEYDFSTLAETNLPMLQLLVPLLTGDAQVNLGNYITKANSLYMTIQTLKEREEQKLSYLPKGCCLFQRKDGRWDARIRIKGQPQINVACCYKKADAYDKLIARHKEIKNVKPTPQVKEIEYTLFSWLDHWHKVFRLPKLETGELSKNTIISDIAFIKRIKKDFDDIALSKLTADYIQQKLYAMTLTRTCEGVYTVLKLALDKAKSRTGGRSVMAEVEKVKHERKRGRALTKEEIEKLLVCANSQEERDVINFYIHTGVRVDEITRVLVKHIDLNRNEIYIGGTKTKLSRRTMPIMPPLKSILERLIANRNGDEKLFRYSTPMIRVFHRAIKEKSKVKYTLKDYRHTFATNCKDNGIPSSVYFRWFGWSDDTMARKIYTHVTDYERQQAQEWASKFS